MTAPAAGGEPVIALSAPAICELLPPGRAGAVLDDDDAPDDDDPAKPEAPDDDPDPDDPDNATPPPDPDVPPPAPDDEPDEPQAPMPMGSTADTAAKGFGAMAPDTV